MPVREQLGGHAGQEPLDRGAAPSRAGAVPPGDQPVGLEPVQVLAHRRLGQPELDRQVGGGGAVDPLQPVEHPALGVGHLGGHDAEGS